MGVKLTVRLKLSSLGIALVKPLALYSLEQLLINAAVKRMNKKGRTS
jgi:hypothetical protein